MNPKLKTSLILLGSLTAVLILSQLTMGLLIVKGQAGGTIPFDYPLPKLVKMHQHSGYLTVSVALVYVATSLYVLLAIPARPKA